MSARRLQQALVILLAALLGATVSYLLNRLGV